MKVLLTGSNHKFMEHLTEILSANVQKLLVANTSVELEAHLLEDIDVALVDLIQCQEQSIKQMQRIRQMQPLTQIICLVPSNDIKVSIKAMKNGAFDEIRPPFSWDLLNEKMESAYKKKKRKRGRRNFWQTIEDHFVAGSLAKYGAPEMGRQWLEECSKKRSKK